MNFARKHNKNLHWYYATDSHSGKVIEDQDLKQHLASLHSGKTNQRLGKLPLVIGMPVMICQNFDVEGGIVNGCPGTLKRIRFCVDEQGQRHAISCEIEAPTTTCENLPNLAAQHVAALQDTVDMCFIHPHSRKSCTIKRTQLPIIPAFAMTAHKAQGQTMERAIVDLQSCFGTESAYVMASRVKSLNGLAILRPFDKRKIQSRQSEDSRKEAKRLEYLNLHTIMRVGSGEESASAQQTLRNRYQDQLCMDNNPKNSPTSTTDSAKQLQKLQTSNEVIISRPSAATIVHASSITSTVIDEISSSMQSLNFTNKQIDPKKTIAPHAPETKTETRPLKRRIRDQSPENRKRQKTTPKKLSQELPTTFQPPTPSI